MREAGTVRQSVTDVKAKMPWSANCNAMKQCDAMKQERGLTKEELKNGTCHVEGSRWYQDGRQHDRPDFAKRLLRPPMRYLCTGGVPFLAWNRVGQAPSQAWNMCCSTLASHPHNRPPCKGLLTGDELPS
uniref:Uncharacterized protein n=1 Tax=Eutreptiella gymnastica TaxID=73025 RepID=A0A7S4GBJ1_9EUGL